MRDNGPYDIVHTHVLYNSGFIVRAAAEVGIPIRIVHSHDNLSYLKENIKKKAYYLLMRRWILKYSTKICACSSLAGEFLFGKKAFSEKGIVVFNSINVDKFAFDSESRTNIRKQFGLKDEKVFGTIGRIEKQKNQGYLLYILKELIKEDKDYKLIIVGEGKLEEELKKKAEELGVKENVIFTGTRSDIKDILCAMDLFALTSIHEGLGIVLIEAQANGLPCIAPENIVPKEAKVLDTFRFMPYAELDNLNIWVDAIKEMINEERKPRSVEKVKDFGYDLKCLADKLEDLYD